MEVKYDFSGYATKNNIQCTDGRIIRRDAFKNDDGLKVPLVWQHKHDDPQNVLGHAILENREDGVYAYATLNNTDRARHTKALITHGDITAFSIFANQLKQQGNSVIHGAIREVSLVLTGANPGALIENISFAHADGTYESVDEEAVIYMGGELRHGDDEKETKKDPNLDDDTKKDTKPEEDKKVPKDGAKEEEGQTMVKEVEKKKEEKKEEDMTVKEVFDTLTEIQKQVVYAMIGEAVKGETDDDEEETVEHGTIVYEDDDYIYYQADDLSNQQGEGDDYMSHNVFESNGMNSGAILSHAEEETIIKEAKANGSLRDTVMAHAATYGIENVDLLFPDAQLIDGEPYMQTRDMEWVAAVIDGTKKSPFAKTKSLFADLTTDEARAKGYVKGGKKIEEVFKMLKRETTPTTIYKKQKIDRDDMLDIKSFKVIPFLKNEMKTLLKEEVARAILVGDGRTYDDTDKVSETNIRPIYTDNEVYAPRWVVENETDYADLVDEIVRARKEYKGKGQPTFYTTGDVLTELLLVKDKMGRKLHDNEKALTAALRVKDIVEVEVMDGLTHTTDGETRTLVGILTDLRNYNVGTDTGGEVTMFDDFDIDFNQHKYLMETRMSGALIHPKAAVVIERKPATDPVEP